MLEISDDEALVPLHVKLCDGFNLIRDNAGTGKTYTFKRIRDYYAIHGGITCALVDYSNYEHFHFEDKFDLLLLDNADLYLNEEILTQCLNNCGIVVCSAKRYFAVPGFKTHYCFVKADNKLANMYSACFRD